VHRRGHGRSAAARQCQAREQRSAHRSVWEVEQRQQDQVDPRTARTAVQTAGELGDRPLDRLVEPFELVPGRPGERAGEQIRSPEGQQEACVRRVLDAEVVDRQRRGYGRLAGIGGRGRRHEIGLGAAYRPDPHPRQEVVERGEAVVDGAARRAAQPRDLGNRRGPCAAVEHELARGIQHRVRRMQLRPRHSADLSRGLRRSARRPLQEGDRGGGVVVEHLRPRELALAHLVEAEHG
jgi:hypothetical protein